MKRLCVTLLPKSVVVDHISTIHAINHLAVDRILYRIIVGCHVCNIGQPGHMVNVRREILSSCIRFVVDRPCHSMSAAAIFNVLCV